MYVFIEKLEEFIPPPPLPLIWSSEIHKIFLQKYFPNPSVVNKNKAGTSMTYTFSLVTILASMVPATS